MIAKSQGARLSHGNAICCLSVHLCSDSLGQPLSLVGSEPVYLWLQI